MGGVLGLEVVVGLLERLGRVIVAFGFVDEIPGEQRRVIFDLRDELGRGEWDGL